MLIARRAAGAAPLVQWVLLVSLAFAFVLGVGCAKSDPLQQERYARRVAPPSGAGWIQESAIALDKQAIWEATRFAPGTTPTAAQQRAADELVERTFAATQKFGWHHAETAFAAGWAKTHHDPHHYRNDAYLLDDRILDPEHPEFLMYYQLEGQQHLAGVMYLARTRSEQGQQVGGPLTVWHFHTWRRAQCAIEGIMPRGWAAPDGSCKEGLPKHRSAEMIHVWLIDRPNGPFSTEMAVSSEEMREGLSKRLAERGF